MRLNQLGKEVDNKKKLFKKGIDCFNQRNYYDAHEYWEELWSEYYLPDANFIQGLIQLSVGYFHITNLNMNGANGLLSKSIKKLSQFRPQCREIDVNYLIQCAEKSLSNLSKIDNVKEFDWLCSPLIKCQKNEKK